jgi:predicted PurR-regulated permease PerM
MTKLAHLTNILFTKKFLSKFIAYFILIVFFYIFKDFLGIFLLTFIFSYLFLASSEFIKSKLDSVLCNHCTIPKTQYFLKKFFSLNLIIIIEYIIFISVIVFIVSSLIPQLINELSELPKNMPFLADPIV